WAAHLSQHRGADRPGVRFRGHRRHRRRPDRRGLLPAPGPAGPGLRGGPAGPSFRLRGRAAWAIVAAMIDLLKKSVLAGLGMAVVTKEKVEEALGDFVRDGKLNASDAKIMAEKIAEQGRKEF